MVRQNSKGFSYLPEDLLLASYQNGLSIDFFSWKKIFLNQNLESNIHLAKVFGDLYLQEKKKYLHHHQKFSSDLLIKNFIFWIGLIQSSKIIEAFFSEIEQENLIFIEDLSLLLSHTDDLFFLDSGIFVLCHVHYIRYPTVISHLLSFGNQNSFPIRLNLLLFFSQNLEDQTLISHFDDLFSRFGASTFWDLLEPQEESKDKRAAMVLCIKKITKLAVLSNCQETQKIFHESLKSYMLRKPKEFRSFLSFWGPWILSELKDQSHLMIQFHSLMVFSLKMSIEDVALILFLQIQKFKPELLASVLQDRKMSQKIHKYLDKKNKNLLWKEII